MCKQSGFGKVYCQHDPDSRYGLKILISQKIYFQKKNTELSYVILSIYFRTSSPIISLMNLFCSPQIYYQLNSINSHCSKIVEMGFQPNTVYIRVKMLKTT